MSNKIPNIDNEDELRNYITNYSFSKTDDKKQKGEVFTPIIIINTMLDELENVYFKEHQKNIFENKNLTWYDNSSGIGNIMICVYFKLFNGLKKIILDDGKRKKHIIEKMLYMSELNENNVVICKKIFNFAKLNINCGNSLEDTQFNIDSFDIIIGNPPYQKQNKKNNLARGGTNNNLYIDFISHSINSLVENGYLVYIHPQNWRKIDSDIFKKVFKKKDLLHVSLNYGGNLFKDVSVKTDFYVLKNKTNEYTSETNIKCYDKKSKLIFESNVILDDSINFIPTLYSEQIKNIMSKINIYGVEYECLNNSDCHKVRNHVQKGKDDKFKYPLYNTSGNPYDYFSSRPHKDQNKKKVLMSSSGKLGPNYDNGCLGTTQDSMYFIVESKSEGEYLVKVLKTKLYEFLININHWGNFRNEPRLLNYLKYPKYKKIENLNDNYIYNYYKLKKEEIEIIEKYYSFN